ncbi:MAG: Wzz/FepE/Etk N-terminal domain-containing protein [Sulfuricaulis sp.]
MNNLPVVSRETAVSVVTPVIPLNFVYPGLSLAQILSIIRAYRKLSLLILLAVLSLTALVMALWPRTYTAMVTLMVNYEVNDPLNGKELPVGQVGSYISTQVELMQTPEVLLAVVDRLQLTENKDYARGYRGDSGTLREWVAKKVSKNLAVYQGQLGSQLIYVTYSANKPAEAAQVANTVAEVYLTSNMMRSLKSQLTGQEARMARLNITLASRHPEVVELQSQIDATRLSLAAQSNNLSAGTSAEKIPAVQQEALPVEYKFTTAGHYFNVSFVSRATPPVKAGKPKVMTGLMLGIIAAGVLGLGIPLAYELFNRRVRCRDDLERHHGIPVLAEFGALPPQTSTLPMRTVL